MLIAYGIWGRSGRLILAGGIVGNCAATAAYLLGFADHGLHLDLTRWIGLAQLNGIVAAGFSLAWMGVSVWNSRRRTEARPPASWAFLVQVGIAVACNALVLVPAWLTLVLNPSRSQLLLEAADAWGWCAGLLTAAAIVGASRMANTVRHSGLWAVLFAGGATLFAWTACRWDTGNWLGYHVLLASHLLASCVVAAAGWLSAETTAERHRATQWSLIALAVSVALGLRALVGDPQAPWWTLGALAIQALLTGWLAWWSLRRELLFVAAVFINVAASVWWLHHVRVVGTSVDLAELIEINIVALALPAVVWLLIELRRFRPQIELVAGNGGPAAQLVPLHRVAARVSLAALGLIICARLGLNAIHAYLPGPVPLTEWLALSRRRGRGHCLPLGHRRQRFSRGALLPRIDRCRYALGSTPARVKMAVVERRYSAGRLFARHELPVVETVGSTGRRGLVANPAGRRIAVVRIALAGSAELCGGDDRRGALLRFRAGIQ